MIEFKFDQKSIKNQSFEKYVNVIDNVFHFIRINDINAEITIKFNDSNVDKKKLEDLLFILKKNKITKLRYD